MSPVANPYRDENGVLRNKLGIIDADALRQVEYQLTRVRALELQLKPIEGGFDLAHLKAIHKHLFQDVYGWAGQERSINVSKRSLTEPGWKTVFARTEEIGDQAGRAHALTETGARLKGLDSEAFVERVTEVYAAWNAAHPFPEGNGRALNTMLTQLAREAGHEIAFRRIPGDLWLDAAEKSLPRIKIDDPHQQRAADLQEIREIFEYITDARPERSVPLEPIRVNQYPEPDRATVQAAVMTAVQSDPQWFIDAYRRDERSMEGRYVAADLFKETFEEFSASNESRNRYNGPVHNSAAVLSAELFRQNLADKSEPQRDTVILLTGVPGAGKTTSVMVRDQGLPEHVRAVFEGQMSNPATAIDKVQRILDAGFRPVVQVVHALPETALANTLKRFEEEGRGASIQVMSSIQGDLPDSLAQVKKQFGDAVELVVIDVRDHTRPAKYQGWEQLDLLRSEGNHEQIKQRLSTALERHRAQGSIPENAYRQAAGLPPLSRDVRLAGERLRGTGAHEPGRGVSPVDGSQEAVPRREQERNR
jgi:fido (protein-threonine AMPylation protein)